MANQDPIHKLQHALQAHQRLLVLTGAGISVDSGLPAYRNAQRQWQHKQPMQYADFMAHAAHRRRYWLGSFLGWPRFSRAQPNPAHQHLAWLEQHGLAHRLVTQNVDGLHQRAGSRAVLDLHGRLDQVLCLRCGRTYHRDFIQSELVARYGDPSDHAEQWEQSQPRSTPHLVRPDGDVTPSAHLAQSFEAPACIQCQGILKPEVVFFGESIPKRWRAQADQWLAEMDALLVVGSSLSVFSGFRFVKAAHAAGKPIYCINQGETRGDALIDVKIEHPASAVLGQIRANLS